MSVSTTREIVRRKRKEYVKSTKAAKKRTLDELEEFDRVSSEVAGEDVFGGRP